MVARCKPLTKDHLPLTTTFPGTKGWSLVTGFTVHARRYSQRGGGGGAFYFFASKYMLE